MVKKAQFVHWTSGIISFAMMLLVITGVAIAANQSIKDRGEALELNTALLRQKQIMNQFLSSEFIYENNQLTVSEFLSMGNSNGYFSGNKNDDFEDTFKEYLSEFGYSKVSFCYEEQKGGTVLLIENMPKPCEDYLDYMYLRSPELFIDVISADGSILRTGFFERQVVNANKKPERAVFDGEY